MMKKCKQCGRRKDLTQFALSSRSGDGRESRCFVCKGEEPTDEVPVEAPKVEKSTTPKWNGQTYTGVEKVYQRNTGHKEIKSIGYRC
jgi:hypothetical protein